TYFLPNDALEKELPYQRCRRPEREYVAYIPYTKKGILELGYMMEQEGAMQSNYFRQINKTKVEE
ncbi:MAG: hypothetical protein AAFQ98_26830, partial [Bacteroidota bacterium]